ncbi:hypothetical protein F4V43_19200 [Paenibacillus spiritus]|uniref:Bacterial toxin 24 domain-containing protein n=1 Tax=Paenibacillus spiritus TaxID=2496557 RepID=A0A5J5FS97_9BACL|nr:hypothetical protein [Paenibacillus spiritus]KAA8995774.1 hypothetical protein F4V43_19200 [Paenibacillus spiritus]
MIYVDPSGHKFRDIIKGAVDAVSEDLTGVKVFGGSNTDYLSGNLAGHVVTSVASGVATAATVGGGTAVTVGSGGTAAAVAVPVTAAAASYTSTVAVRAAKNAGDAAYQLSEGNSGRSKNKLKPDPEATGDHSVLNRDPKTGEVKNYETFKQQTNPKNPNPWETEKRYDGTGDGHFNKATKQDVPNPHVHDPSTPGGVRPPEPWEIP